MVDIPSSDGGAFKSMLVRVQSWAPLIATNPLKYCLVLSDTFIMKRVLFIIALFMPVLVSHAQHGTGSVVISLGPLIHKMTLVYEANETIAAMEKQLVSQDAKCSPSQRLLKTNNLMESYIKLSLFKNPKFAGDNCDVVKSYLACINDKSFSTLATNLSENASAASVLMSRYDIPEEQAKGMIAYFQQLGKK